MNRKLFQKQQEQNHFAETANRACSFTIGTCFGGTVELSMRKNNGSNTFAILQPVEVTEIIHQLAASIGCHIHLQPRRDFSSWRDWKYTEEELAHYRGIQPLPGVGHPPHVNDMAPHNDKGAVLPPPELQPGLKIERNDHEPVATKKTVNRRSTKRAAATA